MLLKWPFCQDSQQMEVDVKQEPEDDEDDMPLVSLGPIQ
jgi:hypothetical protein